nr:MAG TPA: hypothetical protein [Caudoviricetes sp.]
MARFRCHFGAYFYYFQEHNTTKNSCCQYKS